jgi:N6-adenosine-specific RNA methylase IME4
LRGVSKNIDPLEAELSEIDENLARGGLSPAEEAGHHARRKVVYLTLHPDTGKGKAPGKAGGGKKREKRQNAAYGVDAARKTGKHLRTVQKAVARGEKIIDVHTLYGTTLDKGDELDAVIKLGQEAQDRQKRLIAMAKQGDKVSAKQELKKVRREKKERTLATATEAASTSLGSKLYAVIYADPPWRFEPWSRETGMDRAADNHYPTEDLDKIKATIVPAAEDAVLFLWATAPMLPQALEVMNAWGFTYRSNCIWDKEVAGTGYWFRSQHEQLLVGTKGNIPAPDPSQVYSSIIRTKRTDHSRKPPDFAEIIETLFPTAPRLEMFAREQRLGWDVWGNEVADAAE